MKIKELFHYKKIIEAQENQIKRYKEELAQYHFVLTEMAKNEKEQDTIDINNVVVINFPHETVYANKVLNRNKSIDSNYHHVSFMDYIDIFSEKKILSEMTELKSYIPSKVLKNVLYHLYLKDNDINPKSLRKLVGNKR